MGLATSMISRLLQRKRKKARTMAGQTISKMLNQRQMMSRLIMTTTISAISMMLQF